MASHNHSGWDGDLKGDRDERSRYVVADKGYDSDALRRNCTRHDMLPIINRRRMHRRPRRGLPQQFEQLKYRQRSVIERLFGWLKEKRRLNTRYDKLASSFKAMETRALHEGRLFRQNLALLTMLVR